MITSVKISVDGPRRVGIERAVECDNAAEGGGRVAARAFS